MEQFGALREDQVDRLIKTQFPNNKMEITLYPLLSRYLVRKNSGYLFSKNGKLQEKLIDAVDIMLLIGYEESEKFMKGTDPFILTFFKHRNGKLWRYDICPVAYGTESVISAQLEGISAKYRMLIFVLEKEEQIQGIRLSCEHCYVLKNNGEYEFFLYSKEGE